jgi:ABC-type uncharacterized transport system auxiliary subunit
VSARKGRRAAVISIVALAMTAAACGKGSAPTGSGTPSGQSSARPSTPATVKILSPSNGQTVLGPRVNIDVQLTGATISSVTTTKIVPTLGHLHVYVDDQVVSMNFSASGSIGKVSAGQHVLRVEFVAQDHRPWNPRVFDQIVFEVKD